MKKLTRSFYKKNAITVAPLLLGKLLVRRINGKLLRFRITETECYYGEEDSACHARFGKTNRTMPLYEIGGIVYVYMCYGLHYLFNVVTGNKNHPEAVLIRGIEGYNGPAKLTKALNITGELNGTDLVNSKEIWIEDDGYKASYKTDKRIGIDYATEPYKSIKWRFILVNNK